MKYHLRSWRTVPQAGGLEYNCKIDEVFMSKVRVAAYSISLDGYGAGPRQDLQNPLGVRGTELHGWFFHTEVFKKMQGASGGSKGVDNEMAMRSFENVGAGFLAATCLVRCAVRGRRQASRGTDGGARILRITWLSSCSRITLALRSRWRVGPRFTSSPTASARLSIRQKRQREVRMCASAEACRPFASISLRGRSTKCT